MMKMNVKNSSALSCIKVLDDGVVNRNKEYIGAVKIGAINLKDYRTDEKEIVHDNFTYFLQKIDQDFQIFVVDEEIDIKSYIEQLNELLTQLDLNDSQDLIKRSILNREKTMILNNTLLKNVSKKGYYFLYSAKDTKKLKENEDIIVKCLKMANISGKVLTRKEIVSLNYKYHNTNRATYEKLPSVYSNNDFNINDFLQFETFEYKNDGLFDYIYSQGVFQKVMYFAGYPDMAFLGWLYSMCNYRDCDLSFHFKNTNITNLKKIYDERLRELRIAYNKAEKDSERVELEKEIVAQQQMIAKISGANMKGYKFFATIRTKAKTLEKLKENIEIIKDGFGKRDFILRDGFFEQNMLYEANSPCMIFKYSKTYAKEMISDVLALGYPFIKDDLMDEHLPINIGRTLTNSAVFLDTSTTNEDRLSRNEFYAGKTGSGKTTLLLMMMWYRFARGEKQFVFDVEGNQMKNCIKYLKGDVVDCSNSKNGCINPLQVRIELQDSDNEDNQVNLKNYAPLSLHMMFLREFFRVLNRSNRSLNSDTRIKVIEVILYKMYERFNITKNTTAEEILNMKNTDFPIMKDLYEEATRIKNDINSKEYKLIPEEIWDDLLLDLYGLYEGSEGIIFNGHTTIDLYNNPLILFDLSGLYNKDRNLFVLQYYNCCSLVWGYIISDSSKQIKRIYQDEGHTLLDDEFPEIGRFERSIIKRIRKYNAGVCFATQELKDATKSIDGESVLTQSQYKFLFKLDDISIEFLKKTGRYQSDDLDFILNKATRGQCILEIDKTKTRMNIELGYLKDVLDGFKPKT